MTPPEPGRLLRWRYRITGFPGSEWAQDGKHLFWVWVIARLAVFGVWLLIAPSTQGDVIYYWSKIDQLAAVGPEQTLVEYPTPVIWLLQIPYLLGFGTKIGYVIAFVGCMLALDIGFSWSMWRNGGRLRSHALLFWTAFLALVGPTAYLRFDLIPAVLSGWALVSLTKRRYWLAGGFIGAGAATKLWPALMWPALCLDKKSAWRSTIGVFGFGGILALISLLWAGWDRLLSPLTWQSGRQLQVESIWASLPMLARVFVPDQYWVGISTFQAFEIVGPGVGALVALASLSTMIGYLGAVVIYILWWRLPRRRLIESAALMLLVVLIIIITNKTFSPQYIMWLGGPLAAGFAVVSFDHTGRERSRVHAVDQRRLVRMGWVVLGLTALTQLVYPIGYGPLVQGTLGMTAVTLVLVVRNIGIVALLCWNLAWVLGFLRRRTSEPASPAPEKVAA
ncbi:glycosyltransferase 87 family protein [Propionibacteriaceae bacterium Y1923]|uniref:glycosyltransferase 87 family protein n=1 Tax=Aestuariimicrobium sp. Y1814 TaxID=3418742 RepID=UPI003C28618B